MKHFNTITVLAEFRRLFRFLTAFNSENFRQNDQDERLKSIGYTCGSIFILIILPIWFWLIAWYILEDGFEWDRCVVSVPILVTLVQLQITFVGLILFNRTIDENITHLEQKVNQRKSI